MIQTIKYTLLRLLRNKNELLWILLFPIILGCLFKAGFSSLTASDTFEPIPVAVVKQNETTFAIFREVLDALCSEGDQQILTAAYCSREEAMDLLEKQEVDGILTVNEKVELTISANMGNDTIDQNILLSIVQQYNLMQDTITDIAVNRPEKITDAINILTAETSYNEEVRLSESDGNTYTQYFYNLIAMACLFTATAGMRIALHNQGNLSALGARRNLSPTHKLLGILGEYIGYVLFNFACNLIAFAFVVFVLKIDLTAHLPLAILTIFVACLTGISFGFFIGSIGSKSENTKESITWAVTMTGCFLSGLMVGNMRIIVEMYCPIINRINPAALISDCFYALATFSTFDRYIQDILTLTLLMILFISGGFFFTRRKKYASL